MEKTLKCAVVGMGMLGTQHADRLLAHGTTKLVAVCDIKPGKAAAWTAGKEVLPFEDCEAMLKECSIDLLVVATQDPYHRAPLLLACAHRIPYVICEKPLTTTLEEALEVQAAAKAAGTTIKVLFPNRFYPLDRSIKTLIGEGFVGAPEFGEFRIDDSIDVPLSLWGSDSKSFAALSSPAYFLLSHAVDLLYYLLAPRTVKEVYAVGRQSVIGSDLDYIDSFLQFEDGTLIRLKSEWTKRMDNIVENYLQLTAKEGGFIFNKTGGFQSEQGLVVSFDSGEEKAVAAQARLSDLGYHCKVEPFGKNGAFAVRLKAAESGNDFDWNSAICIYADSFLDGEDPRFPLTSLEMGIEQVRVVEAIVHSAKENRKIIL